VRAKRAEYGESKDGADERETSDDAADPATFGDGADIFRKERHGAERDELELHQEPAVLPSGEGFARGRWLGGSLGRSPEFEENSEESDENDGPRKIDIALAVNGELIGAVPLVERRVGPVALEFRMMNGDPMNRIEGDERNGGKDEARPTFQERPNEAIGANAENKKDAEWVREVDDRKEQRGGDNAARFCRPQEGECETAQADGEVIVHVAHVENVAVGKHGDERSEEPRRTARGGVDEGEDSPEERENAEGDSEFFGEGEANDFGEIVEDEIEEDVIPLPGEIEAGGFALVDEFGEPGVVGVAAEIAGLNVGVPEAGDEEKDGDEREEKNGAARDRCHCDEDSIARMGGEWPVSGDR
jgi:hypothetical protein